MERQKIDAEVRASLMADKTGWVKRGDTYLYAERNKYDETKLMVKTYANKKQANKKIDKLKKLGFNAFVSDIHPYTIKCCVRHYA